MMPFSRQPLARRIIAAFTLMTLVVSGTFALSIVLIVHEIEEHLVSREMENEIGTIITEDLALGRSLRLSPGSRFFASDNPALQAPAQFASLEAGFAEVLDGDEAYYVYTREIDRQRYQLVQDQREFEVREDALYSVVLCGFLLSIAGAWVLGTVMARRVMAPVTRLAGNVLHLDQIQPDAPALAADYPPDEIGDLAAAFDSTLGRLRETLERERLFTNDVSHELRTPLMVIASSCELLLAGKLGARERPQVERIVQAAGEMNDLVQALLVLARASHDSAASVAGCTVASAASEMRLRWEPEVIAKGLMFECIELAGDPVLYNRTALHTVMDNLLRNAIHYTERGRIRLVLEDGAFSIEDTGIGLPLAERKQVFEPFARGSQARGEGLGLGLSIVQRLCASQGWSISIDEAADGGSRFSVRLKPA